MKKEKVLFVVTDFAVGGITSSLFNIIDILIKHGHEVDVINFAKVKRPELLNPNVGFIDLSGRELIWNLSAEDLVKANGLKKIKYLILGLIKKILNRTDRWNALIFKKTFFSGYDVAVAFRQSPFSFWFLKNKTDARVKAGFWHVELRFAGDISSWDHTIQYLDRLACVSDAVKKEMVNRYKYLDGRAFTVYNTFDSLDIKKKSEEYSPGFDEKSINIVTVARIDLITKRLDIIPEIYKMLKDCGKNIMWYIVGDGPDKNKLEEIIILSGLQDKIILCGNKSNPFPYVKNADIFVLTSLTESFGMVVSEALICGTPVVAGEYPALCEVLDDGVNGIIAGNSAEGISMGINELISDGEKYSKLKENCMSYEYDRDIAYRQFMDMVR